MSVWCVAMALLSYGRIACRIYPVSGPDFVYYLLLYRSQGLLISSFVTTNVMVFSFCMISTEEGLVDYCVMTWALEKQYK